MRKSLLFSLLVILAGTGIAVLPQSVRAQASRLYFASYLGLNTNSASDFKESTSGRSGDFQYDNSLSFAGAIGLRLNKQLRVEGEISYRTTDFDRINLSGPGSFKMGGDLSTWLYMANAYYDFDLEWKHITPFVTAGIGVAHHNGTIDDSSGFVPDASDSSYALAWQLGGGLKYRLNDGLAFTGGYRYVGTTDIDFDSYKFEYGSHEWRVGLEWDLPVPGLK